MRGAGARETGKQSWPHTTLQLRSLLYTTCTIPASAAIAVVQYSNVHIAHCCVQLLHCWCEVQGWLISALQWLKCMKLSLTLAIGDWAETQFGEKALFSTGGNSAVHRPRQKVKTFSLKVNLGGCCHNSSLTFLTLTLSSEKEQPRQRVYMFSWTPFVLVLPFMVLRKLLVALSIIPATSSRPSPLAWSGNGIKEKIDWRIKDC